VVVVMMVAFTLTLQGTADLGKGGLQSLGRLSEMGNRLVHENGGFLPAVLVKNRRPFGKLLFMAVTVRYQVRQQDAHLFDFGHLFALRSPGGQGHRAAHKIDGGYPGVGQQFWFLEQGCQHNAFVCHLKSGNIIHYFFLVTALDQDRADLTHIAPVLKFYLFWIRSTLCFSVCFQDIYNREYFFQNDK
jgi:hypothetical protein